jgi:hypothetical protein
MKTNAKLEQLREALNFVNKSFDDNIKFKTLEQKTSKIISFTLTVKDSKKPGGRLRYQLTSKGNRKHIAAACWHVHGYFLEYLFLNYSGIYVWSLGKKLTSNNDNWEDKNIGSYFQPLMFSEACDC